MSLFRSKKTRHPLTSYLIVTFAIGALSLTGCASTNPAPPATASAPAAPSQAFLTEHGLAGLDAQQVIQRLDTLPIAQRPQNLITSVRPGQLILTDEQQDTALPMPEDLFYLSVAPYRDQTHDCYYHSLTTCLGEMQNTEVHVTVTDKATGENIVDKTTTTYDNGFLGLWLPRGIEATLTVKSGALTASAPVSTQADNDATCLTTLRLT